MPPERLSPTRSSVVTASPSCVKIYRLLRGALIQMPPVFGTFWQAQRITQPGVEQQGLDFE